MDTNTTQTIQQSNYSMIIAIILFLIIAGIIIFYVSKKENKEIKSINNDEDITLKKEMQEWLDKETKKVKEHLIKYYITLKSHNYNISQIELEKHYTPEYSKIAINFNITGKKRKILDEILKEKLNSNSTNLTKAYNDKLDKEAQKEAISILEELSK